MGGEGKRKGRGEREKEIGSKENRTGRMKGLGNGEGGVAKLKLGKTLIFPYVGKNFKTSFSYFSLPLLLHFASFSGESSLPFPSFSSPFLALLCLLFSLGCAGCASPSSLQLKCPENAL